ncbi:biofilm regulation protein kinase SiaB [Halomonas koreensis]|uniref:Biofilm regulation protein kinase SiaB n=1 Tax=Halomonas koreensis TaxID=245385 RepID=A0ABU1G3P0_9GAMM|nr:biofilm regulation protein kinase SiaB [Halomonas koreensis]MDR5867565.1 biofilm regulation protein kinase SiaB [Halomonas koreensis]
MDLLTLRDTYLQQRIMLCFNGPISRSLIEEIGHALRNYLNSQSAAPSAAMDVFAVYIEMTQNIRHYARARGYSEEDATATLAVARDAEDRYLVSAGNLVEETDGRPLVEAVEHLATLDAAELKRAYKQQLRRPRDEAAPTGAGLGLIDMARKSSRPLQARLQPLSCGRSLFSLTATI